MHHTRPLAYILSVGAHTSSCSLAQRASSAVRPYYLWEPPAHENISMSEKAAEEKLMLKRIIEAALMIILLASVASGQTTNTNCTATSTSASTTNVDCTSNTTTYGQTPAQAALQVEQQKEMNENMSKIGASLGTIVARKRAQRVQEKSDLTAVVYCRQNPSGSWTFPGKAPMGCETFGKNVVAYCTVNAKTPICKDVAKLGPAPVATQAAAPPPVQVQSQFQTKETPVQTPPVQTVAVSQPPLQVQAEPQQAVVASQPVRNAIVPQTQQMQNVDAIPAQEISVAEAARRNKAAKEAAKAKENPPPQP
jgi:hypothetical protein